MCNIVEDIPFESKSQYGHGRVVGNLNHSLNPSFIIKFHQYLNTTELHL
jgi:hypothetical protein